MSTGRWGGVFFRARLLYAGHSIVSLAYEILWVKMIAPYLGMTQAALGTVLTCFVTGLALGSLAVSRLKLKRSRTTGSLFVTCQIALGLWALVLPMLLSVLDFGYVYIAPPVETLSHHFWRAVIASGLLLPPSIFIGMAFPLLSEWVENSTEPAGRNAASLYKDGLLCSAIGAAFLPSILLIFFGIRAASTALAAVNFAIAGLAFLQLSTLRDEVARSSPVVLPGVSEPRPPVNVSLYLTSFLLGAVLFIVEIAGAQFLWLAVNDTFYAHAILVAEVLCFMGLGSLVYLWIGEKGPVSLHGPAYALLAFSLWIVVWLLWPSEISSSYALIKKSHWMSPAVSFLIGHGVLIALILAIPAISSGWAFTAFCQRSVRDECAVRSPLGRLAAWNYLGSAIGSVMAIFIFIPHFGLTKTLAGTAIFTSLAAVSLIWGQRPIVKQRPIWMGCLAIVFFSVFLGAYGDVTFQHRAGPPNHQVIFHHEDGTGVTEVFEDKDTGDRRLYTCRLRMEGSNEPREKVFKSFQGALPVVLHPRPHRLLVIGLGTGISLAAHLRPEIQEVTCIEYATGVMQAANYFGESNLNVQTNPKVKVVRQDGRNFARLSRSKYDLIIQDLFFPYQTGTGYLYTAEHYEALRARLAPGGHVAQWIALHQMNVSEVKSVVRTFLSVFPNSTAWLHGRFLMLNGGRDRWDWPELKSRIENHPGLIETNAYDLLGRFLAGKEALAEWSRDAVINTDDNLLVERRAPLLDTELDSDALGNKNIQSLLSVRDDVLSVLDNVSSGDKMKISHVTQSYQFFLEGVSDLAKGNPSQGFRKVQDAYRLNPRSFPVRDFMTQHSIDMAGTFLKKNAVPKALNALEEAFKFQPNNREAIFLKAQIEFEKGHIPTSLRLFEKLLALFPNYYEGRLRYARTLLQMGHRQEAFAQFTNVAERVPDSEAATFLNAMEQQPKKQ